ncbi:hypothetical protein TWF730_009115 [Orbilia blumenaviensis]|uniref:SET domain-containing protein n=1 Tax=Orbilia blumenaviensis TaxID=1796055 RepID=A0AAV9UZP6_9PEZI
MAPPNGLVHIVRGQGASYYPSVIIKAIVLLRLRKVISNLSGTRPALSWILYLFAVLFNLVRSVKSIHFLKAQQAAPKPQADGSSNNKDNSPTQPPSSDLWGVARVLCNIICPTMASSSRPPMDLDRRLHKDKRKINSSAGVRPSRAGDKMAVNFTPNSTSSGLDFDRSAAVSPSISSPGAQILQYHANSTIQTVPSATPLPALHMHPENRHMYRYFAGIPPSTADADYPASAYNIRTEIAPYAPSTGRNLTPTSARNLLVGERLWGYCLVVKAILPPKHLDATHVLVEDENGKWEMLNIFDFPYTNHAEDRIGQGQLMIIKEPFYHMVYGGVATIRIDHPSDIKYIMYNHHLVPPKWRRRDAHGLDAEPKILKMDGELRIRWKKYHQAVDCLSLSCQIMDRAYQETLKNFSRPSSSSIYSTARLEVLKQRVSCYQYLKQWENCLADANAILAISFNEKAAWHKSNALLHLYQYDEAKQVLLRIMGASRYKFKECSKLHAQIRNYQGNAIGQYNMTQILERGKEGQREICAGDFVSAVRVKKNLTIGGHGMFAQKDFDAGDLVMVVKAVATVYGDDNTVLQASDLKGEPRQIKYGQKMVARTIERMLAEPKNVGLLMQKLNRENFGSTFFKHDGEYYVNRFWVDNTIEKYAIQHTIYNQRISNRDGILDPDIFPGSNRSSRVSTPAGSANLTPPNASTISIDGSSINSQNEGPRDPELAEQASFFPQAAYMNHSCIPNVRISIFSDLMFVHAASHIRKGDELLIDYLDDDYSPLTQRRELLKQNFDFNCGCSRCEFEYENYEYCIRRVQISEAIAELMSGTYAQNPSVILDGISHCVVTLEYEFKDLPGDMPQFDMAWALMAEEFFRRRVDHGGRRTGRTAELRNLKLALRILKALRAEFEFIEGDVKIFRYGFICKWLVEAWILAAISSARFYGGVFWSLRAIARQVYGILCGETVNFEKIFWGRLEEAEVSELTEEEMLSMADLVEWLDMEGLTKTELAG